MEKKKEEASAKDILLSAEVEPFIPQKKETDILVPMALPNDGNGNGVEAPPIPSYLITCYPFVQENQSNRQLPVYNGDIRWQQVNPNSTGPYLAYPILPTPQPPVSTDYAYYQLMPAPCAPMVGFYSPFPAPYTAPFQPANVVNALSDCNERPVTAGQTCQATTQRSRTNRGPVPKVLRTNKPLVRNVAVQKENNASGPENKSKIVLLVDASQQTDFPGDVANKTHSERASPLLWKSKVRRRRASHPAAESSSEQGASEADIDSDSGYCSPKHSHSQTTSAATRSTECKVDDLTGITGGPSWANVASQAPQRFAIDRMQPFSCGRGGRPVDLRNSQDNSRGKVQSLSSQRTPNHQKNRDWTAGQSSEAPQFVSGQMAGTDQKPDSLCFEDDSEFPELIIGAGVSKSRVVAHDNTQNKNSAICQLSKKQLGLGDLPETSPINIVQTPIPITTAIPKRAKSQRKKALAAALATAQEYSEISMEQKKLQEALNKAAGRKSKAPVQLDLGDMLAALEKQQQAMKAKQLTNTKPLSYSVGTSTPLSVKDCGNMKTLHKNQQFIGFHNPLDSGAPKIKRGKEREIPKAKRPTALKKIILKEREEKKNRFSIESTIVGTEEQGDEQLNFSEEQSITQEVVSQEDIGLSVPSDTSLSPASQNSPYSMTPVSQGSPVSSGVGSPMASSTITKIHSRRFREYCNQVLSKDIDECVTLLLQELVRFQERIYQKDPIKAKMKRRLVMGLREVTKHMKLKKIKCVIISPNCEKIQSKGGLDEALYNVIAMAREQEIPFVFALGRKALGRCVNKLVPVSVVGIFNYSGAESLFNKLVALTEEARKAYRDMVTALEQEQAEEALKHTRKVPHMGHSRNPSAASAISFCSVISEPISEVNEKEYETNWRNMVEATDAPECSENEKPMSSVTTDLDKSSNLPAAIGKANKPILGIATSSSVGQATRATKSSGSDKEEGKTDDILEWASQQSTETGSLDGSCRDILNSSMISTTSTLVPDMLEEEEDDEEEEEDDNAAEPVTIVVTFSSRIDDWVSEAQKALETLQLSKNIDSTEEDHNGQSDIEELDAVEQIDVTTDIDGCQPAESESQTC
ncbi:selenocysteine insertion sequence-binding protein 2-like isoform X3 [Stegostoma tigrinum]|uniref:selenocysteine insertion sequence-binding protein 2-like isoform X3 n=1 Tax=Stegostoma tigrinum TaxID=3053191 RepID=UPI00202B36C7|nr:selenocysteine insertion sequence-binding protein 2-like isoform X3 [Stegostoma tigrinum]